MWDLLRDVVYELRLVFGELACRRNHHRATRKAPHEYALLIAQSYVAMRPVRHCGRCGVRLGPNAKELP